MQLVVSGNRIMAHGEGFLAMGGTVINTDTGRVYQNATVVECDGCPSDIDKVGYEYHAGQFVPCAPFGAGDGTVAVLCGEDCKSIKDSGVSITHLVHTGTIFWHSGETAPRGYLICDGALVQKEDYPQLYGVLGSTFGEETDTEFYLPNLLAAFIRGAGTNGNYSATLGQTQEATRMARTNDSYIAAIDDADFTSSGTVWANGASSGGNQNYTWYYVRPYNVALTPIIKY